jgi:hypothetical protein
MSSPRTQTTVTADESADPPKRTQLSPVQVAASALAAVSSAVAASFFGVAGTLIGAALASVIATVSTALYTESLRKTNDGLKRVLIGRRTTPAPSPVEPDATRVLPAGLDPRRPPAKRRGPRWSRVGVYAVAVFVVAMGIVTGIEFLGQKPVSAMVGNSDSSRTTTLGELTNASSHQGTTPTTPSIPTTSAPASTGAESSPTSATATGEKDSGSSVPSTKTTSKATSSSTGAPRSTAAPTSSAPTSAAPAEGTAPNP